MVRQLPRRRRSVMMNLLVLVLRALPVTFPAVTIRTQVLHLMKCILPLTELVQPVKPTLQDIQRLQRTAQIRPGHVHRYIGQIPVTPAAKRPPVLAQLPQSNAALPSANHIIVIIAQLADPAGEATGQKFVEFAGRTFGDDGGGGIGRRAG